MNINHGRIQVHLKALLDKNGMSKNKLAHRAEMQWRQIARYYDNEVTRLDTDVLARLCYALNCTLDELITYEPPKED